MSLYITICSAIISFIGGAVTCYMMMDIPRCKLPKTAYAFPLLILCVTVVGVFVMFTIRETL